MEVKFTNLGASKEFLELPPGIFELTQLQRAEYGRLATEEHTNELYQEIVDHCYPLDAILDQFETLESCVPANLSIARGLYIPFSAAYMSQQQALEELPEDHHINKQFALVCIERYAIAAALRYGGELPRGFQLGHNTDTLRRIHEQVPYLINGSVNESSVMVMQFGSELATALSMRDTLRSYDVKHREKNEAKQLKIDNDGLFESARFLQKYQLKTALVAGSGAGDIRDWMVLDWDVMLQEISEANNGEHPIDEAPPKLLARIFGTKKQFIAGKPVFNIHGTGSNRVFRANFSHAIKSAQEGETPDSIFQFGTDGHLKGMRGTSFQEFASHLGKNDEYELLRGEIISIFCDLVLPAHLVNELEEVEKKVLPQRHGKQRDIQTIRRIVMARVRLLQDKKPEIISEIKKELRKRPELHSVIGHVTALPKGRRATAEAREKCRIEMNGKELAPEGETYTKYHTRGGNTDDIERETTGHRAIRQNVGGGVVKMSGLV
jgi:hypothetical protein